MANYSKREKRRQQLLESMETRKPETPTVPLCRCGATAKYEVCRCSV